jgi:hypothetical protein
LSFGHLPTLREHYFARSTVEEIYRLVWAAVANKQPMSGLEPVGSPENWHCVALEKLSS